VDVSNATSWLDFVGKWTEWGNFVINATKDDRQAVEKWDVSPLENSGTAQGRRQSLTAELPYGQSKRVVAPA
jgi:hypothetical protein